MEKSLLIKQVDITRIKDSEIIQMKDDIIDEDILDIFINENKTFQMVFSATHPKELTVGFLYTQGIVKKKKEIITIQFFKDRNQCHVRLEDSALERLNRFKAERHTRGSSGGTLLQNPAGFLTNRQKDLFSITGNTVLELIQQHWDRSELFHKTGAVHSAGLCNETKILSYYEDIGRHNALDKLAGNILLNQVDTKDKIATVSCRMSLEIIGKIIKTNIPVIISNAAPTLSAIKLADRAGLTIVGFARNNRFNIYTHKERIKGSIQG